MNASSGSGECPNVNFRCENGITAIVAGYGLTKMGVESWHLSGLSICGFHVLFALSLVFRLLAIGMARRIIEPTSHGTRHLWQELGIYFLSRTGRRRIEVAVFPATVISVEVESNRSCPGACCRSAKVSQRADAAKHRFEPTSGWLIRY